MQVCKTSWEFKMVLNLPGIKNIFPHSKELERGLSKKDNTADEITDGFFVGSPVESGGLTVGNAAPAYTIPVGNNDASSLVSENKSIIAKDGKLTNFIVRVDTNTLNDVLVCTLLVNEVAKDLTVTFAATETGIKNDLDHEVNVVKGDLINIKLDGTAASSGNANKIYHSLNLTFL